MIVTPPELADPDRRFALIHAPVAMRPALASLWALDERLSRVIAGAREASLAQLRLAWWRQAIALGEARGEPVLDALGNLALDRSRIADMVDGWEVLIDTPWSEATLREHGRLRGGRLFALSGELLSGKCMGAGEGWALTDLARRSESREAWSLAREALANGWSAAPRPLRILARLAERDVSSGAMMPRTKLQLWRALF